MRHGFLKISLFRFVLIVVIAVTMTSFVVPQQKMLLVIGDSISLAYGEFLKKMLTPDYTYSTKNTDADAGNLDFPSGPNGGDSGMVLAYLQNQKMKGLLHADLLLINCGLHDIKTNPETKKRAVEPYLYRSNLDSIFMLAHTMKIPCIWISTIPVNDSIHNAKNPGFYRYNADVKAYNQIAHDVCLKWDIPVIDLYRFSESFPENAIRDHVHYHKVYAQQQAAYIAGFLHHFEK